MAGARLFDRVHSYCRFITADFGLWVVGPGPNTGVRTRLPVEQNFGFRPRLPMDIGNLKPVPRRKSIGVEDSPLIGDKVDRFQVFGGGQAVFGQNSLENCYHRSVWPPCRELRKVAVVGRDRTGSQLGGVPGGAVHQLSCLKGQSQRSRECFPEGIVGWEQNLHRIHETQAV